MIVHKSLCRSRHLVCAAMFLAAVAGMLAPRAQAGTQTSVDHLLSSDTYAFLTVRDVALLKEKWGQTQYGRMLADPALEPFLEDIRLHGADLFSGVEDQIGLTAAELFEVPQGHLTAAVTSNADGELAIVVLLEYGDNQAKVDELVAQAGQRLEEDGAERREEDYLETPLVIFDIPPAPDAPAAATGPQQFVYFLKDEVLVAGNNAAALKEILDRWPGDAEQTLADNPAYARIAEETAGGGDPPLIAWYLDFVGLATAGAGQVQDPNTQMAMLMLPQLGLDKLQGIGGTYDMAVGQYDGVSRIYVYIDGPPVGLLQIFTFPPADLHPEPWAPSDVAYYLTLNWDVDAAWQGVVDISNQMQAGMLDQTLRQMAEDPNGPGIDLVSDVIEPLSGRFTMLTDYEEPVTPESQRMLFAFALDDPKTMASSLDKMLAMAGPQVEKREFEGHVIHELPPMPTAPQLNEEQPVERAKTGIAVANDYLMIATNVRLLEKVLRPASDQESLAQSLDYRLVARQFPENPSWIGFSRPELEMRALYESIRSGQFQEQMAPMALFFPQLLAVINAIDGSKLPEFDVVRRYLAPGGSYMVTGDSGMHFVGFSLRKEAP